MRSNGSGLIAKAATANGSWNGFSVPIAGFHETTTPPIHARHHSYCHGGRTRARAHLCASAGVVLVQLTRRIRLRPRRCRRPDCILSLSTIAHKKESLVCTKK